MSEESWQAKWEMMEERIRELEGYICDHGMLLKDYIDRIAKAKAILKQRNTPGTGTPLITNTTRVKDALAALEGK